MGINALGLMNAYSSDQDSNYKRDFRIPGLNRIASSVVNDVATISDKARTLASQTDGAKSADDPYESFKNKIQARYMSAD